MVSHPVKTVPILTPWNANVQQENPLHIVRKGWTVEDLQAQAKTVDTPGFRDTMGIWTPQHLAVLGIQRSRR